MANILTHPATNTHTYIHTHTYTHTHIQTNIHTTLYTLHIKYTHISKHTLIKIYFFIFYFLLLLSLLLFSISTGGIIPSFQSICLVTTSPIVTASIRQDIITHNYDSRNGYLYSCWMNACLGTQPEMSISPEHLGPWGSLP